MKTYKLLPLVAICSLLFQFSFSQNTPPNFINYQAVVHDNSGNTLNNQEVDLKIKILDDASSIVFSEEHIDIMTNDYGLISLMIGDGSNQSDPFSTINWSAGNRYLEIEINDGFGFNSMGIHQLVTVPYAFHAQTVEYDMVDDADSDSTNEIQQISINGTDISLSDGGTISIPSIDSASIANLGFVAGPHTIDTDTHIDSAGIANLGFITSGQNETDPVFSSSLASGITTADTINWNNHTDDQNLTGATLTGTSLQIDIESGSSTTVDLSTLQDGTGTDDQNINGSGLAGNILTIGIENGTNETVDLSSLVDDADADSTNELQTISINGSDITLSDGGGTITIPVNPAADGSETIINAGTDISVSGIGTMANPYIIGNTFTEVDGDATNELNTSATLNGTNLEITDAGGTQTVDLSSFSSTDDQNVDSLGLNGSILGISIEGGTGATVDLSSITTHAIDDLTDGSDGQGDWNVFLGTNAGLSNQSNGNSNVAVGQSSLWNNTTGDYNTAIGNAALSQSITSNGNTAIGAYSLQNQTSGDGNVAIGRNTGFNNINGSGNVFIGAAAGYNETGSNKLYIDNSITTTPLIYGDFGLDALTINGSLNINSAYTLPTSDGSMNEFLTTDGLGNVSWGTVANDGDWTINGTDMYSAVSGNVGIGSSSPGEKLTLSYDGYLGWEYSSSNNNVAHKIGKQSGIAQPLDFETSFNPGPTGPIFRFRELNANTDVLTMLYNGNVGIGTSSPDELFHVDGGSLNSDVALFESSDDYTVVSVNSNTTNNSGGGFYFSQYNDEDVAYFGGQYLSSGDTIALMGVGAPTGGIISNPELVLQKSNTNQKLNLQVFGSALNPKEFSMKYTNSSNSSESFLISDTIYFRGGPNFSDPTEFFVSGKTYSDELIAYNAFKFEPNANTGYILQSDNSGNAAWVDPITIAAANDGDWTTGTNSLGNNTVYNPTELIGIGTSDPLRKLDLRDNSTGTAAFIQQGNTSGDGLTVYANISSATQNIFKAINNTTGLYVMGDNKVGIGNSIPSSILSIGTDATTSFVTNKGDVSITLAHDGLDTYLETRSGDMSEGLLMLGDGTNESGIIKNLWSNGYMDGKTNNALHIFNKGNEPIIFETNNTQRMKISANGLVGIGPFNPTPGYILSSWGGSFLIADDLNDPFLTINGDNNGISWSLGVDDQSASGGAGNADFVISNSSNLNSPHLTILTGTGNVGIGLTSPSSKLEINGTGSTSSSSSLNITNTAGNNIFHVRDDGFTGVNQTTPIGSANFVVNDYNSSGYGGISVNVNSATGQPFYSYALQGSASAWSYLDGSDGNKLKWYNGGGVRMTLTSIGNLGIGTTVPSYPITAETSSLAMTGLFTNTRSSGNNTAIRGNSSSTSGYNIGVRGNASGSGNVNYGVYGNASNATTNYSVYAFGDMYATGSYLPSDERLKENFKDFNNALDKLSQLDIQTYNFKKELCEKLNLTNKLQFGFTAQNLENIFPSMIKTSDHHIPDENGNLTNETINIKAVNYNQLIPVLIKGMQEQQELIENLQKKVDELEKNQK